MKKQSTLIMNEANHSEPMNPSDVIVEAVSKKEQDDSIENLNDRLVQSQIKMQTQQDEQQTMFKDEAIEALDRGLTSLGR